MITEFTWEVLTKNDKGEALLERLVVDGGWLYRTTERQSDYSDYKSIFAQQVTFVPAVVEPEIKVHDEFIDLAMNQESGQDRLRQVEALQFIKDNNWTRDGDDDLRDPSGMRMIWYRPRVIDDYDVDSWKARGIDAFFDTEVEAILNYKNKA